MILFLSAAVLSRVMQQGALRSALCVWPETGPAFPGGFAPIVCGGESRVGSRFVAGTIFARSPRRSFGVCALDPHRLPGSGSSGVQRFGPRENKHTNNRILGILAWRVSFFCGRRFPTWRGHLRYQQFDRLRVWVWVRLHRHGEQPLRTGPQRGQGRLENPRKPGESSEYVSRVRSAGSGARILNSGEKEGFQRVEIRALHRRKVVS